MKLINSEKIKFTDISCIDGKTYKVVLKEDLDEMETVDLNHIVPLESCPCCKSRAEILQEPVETCDKPGKLENIPIWYVKCKTCGLRTPGYSGSPYRAIECWNRREK